LTATRLSYSLSVRLARKTVPMPPVPIWASSSYAPTRRPTSAPSGEIATRSRPSASTMSSRKWPSRSCASRSVFSSPASDPSSLAARARTFSRWPGGTSIASSKSSFSSCQCSDGARSAIRQLPEEPRACHGRFPLDRRRRDLDDLGRLLDGESRDEPQLDDPDELLVLGREPLEGLVERQDVEVGGLPGDLLRQGHPLRSSAALGAAARAGVVYQDPPHHPCGQRKELRPAADLEVLDACQPQVRLVNESRGLEGRAGALPAHRPLREAPELVVDLRHQGVETRAPALRVDHAITLSPPPAGGAAAASTLPAAFTSETTPIM